MKYAFYSLLAIALFACQTTEKNVTDVFTKVYTIDNITTQGYSIDTGKDTILKGQQGTTLRIDKNTFVNSKGEPVKGPVTVELKEVLNPLDMVLGNLTTTTNGQFLQTGGMVYVNATSGSEQLQIASDKSIGVSVPSDTVLAGMSIFEGKKDSTGINWVNPVPLNKTIDAPAKADSSMLAFKITEGQCNFWYYVDGYRSIPKEVDDYFEEKCNSGKGLRIRQDTSMEIGKYMVHMVRDDNRGKFANYEALPVKGENLYVDDPNLRYTFELSELGWANIDRLYQNPKTQPVNLIVNVKNYTDFDMVYTTMVIEKMYLPGYQKKDNTFCFTHGDDEETQLPVGEATTIIATAYKGEKAYFAIQKFTLEKKQTIDLKLEETTMDNLKKKLKETL
jgi:hypothetical protein